MTTALPYLCRRRGVTSGTVVTERREMFLTAGYEMLNFLIRKGVKLIRCEGWSDYYPNHKGGNSVGRAVEGIPFDAAELGSWSDQSAAAAGQELRLRGATNELRSVQYFNRAPKAFAVATGVFIRTAAARIRPRQVLTNGASLIAQMLKGADRSQRRPATAVDQRRDGRPHRRRRRVVGARNRPRRHTR